MKMLLLSLFLLSILYQLGAQDFQPALTFINLRASNESVRLCSIQRSGEKGPVFYIRGRDEWGIYYNKSVTPTKSLGNFHVLPYEHYDCDVVYQHISTYLVEALSDVNSGKKLIVLVAHMETDVGWPLYINSIALYQKEYQIAYCGYNDCGDDGKVNVVVDVTIPITIKIL